MRGKRLVAALTAVMVTVLLTGCESVGDRIGAGNYVRPYSMTKSEKELTQLLKGDDDYTVIGQFKVDDEYKSIQMGADVYKKGTGSKAVVSLQSRQRYRTERKFT